MLISSKGRYALRLMIYIAALGDAEGKIALREVADREHISQKYLEQLVRPLMKAGLLKSVRGKGGGYMMAKDPAEVRAGDILRAVRASQKAPGCERIYTAGEKEHEIRLARKAGVPINDSVQKEIIAIRDELGLNQYHFPFED